MKKLLTLILALAAVVSLSSCIGASRNNAEDERLSIVTTIFPPYDFATAVAGECADVTMLLPPGSESHDYEPSVGDIAAIARCDLFIYIGGETDRWVADVLSAIDRDINTLRLIDTVDLLEEDNSGVADASHDHDHEHEDAHEEDEVEIDEHIWTSPAYAAELTSAICDALCEVSPENSDRFRASADAYGTELLELDSRFREAAQDGGILIFADRFPFRYLTHELGLEYRSAFSGCSSDSEPSIAAIYRISEEMKEHSCHVILKGEFASEQTAELIAKECNARVMTLHSCHNVSREDFESGVTYLDIMKKNLEVIQACLDTTDTDKDTKGSDCNEHEQG